MSYQIFFPNFGYGKDETYDGFDVAVKAAEKFGFEALISRVGDEAVALWSPISGLRMLP